MSYQIFVDDERLEYRGGCWRAEIDSSFTSALWFFDTLEEADAELRRIVEIWGNGECSAEKRHGKRMAPTYCYKNAYVIKDGDWDVIFNYATSLPNDVDPRIN